MTSVPKKEVERLKGLVSKGKLKEALEATKSHGNSFISLLARFQSAQKERNDGTISFENYKLEINEIRRSYLVALDEYCNAEIVEDQLIEIKNELGPILNSNYTQSFHDYYFLFTLENFFLMRPEFLSFMKDFDKNHILTYHFLRHYRETIQELFKRLSELDEDISDYLYDIGVISNELEMLFSKFRDVLELSKAKEHRLYHSVGKVQKQLTELQRWIMRSMNPSKIGNNREHLSEIAKPQLEIAIENFLEVLKEEERTAAKYSQN